MPKKPIKLIKLTILSPETKTTLPLLSALPIKSTPFIVKGEILENGRPIECLIKWRLTLFWEGTYKTYQSIINLSGNSVKTQVFSGGKLRVLMVVPIGNKNFSISTTATVLGHNPTTEQLKQALSSDILKAIAWQESGWRQFDAKGNPLKNRASSMVGIMQISEWWWGKENAAIKSNDFNRIAWDWHYNIQVAMEILDYYYKRVTTKYPHENDISKWNRTLKAYHAGESTINTKESADDFWYVKKVRGLIKDKPWEKPL